MARPYTIGTVLILALSAASLVAQDPAIVAVQGARILVAPGEEIASGTVLIEDGVIKAVGPNIQVPEGATVVDGRGKVCLPAFIDARHDSLFDQAAGAPGASGPDEWALSVTGGFEAKKLRRVLSTGVGVAYLGAAPLGSRGMTGTVAMLDPSDPMLKAVGDEVAGVEFRVGQSTRGQTDTLRRHAGLKSLNASLDGAKRYKKTWDKYREKVKKYEEDLAEWKKKGKKGGDKKKSEKAPAKKEEKSARPRRRGRPRLPPDFREWPPQKRLEWLRSQRRSRRGGAPAPKASSKKGKDDGRPKPPLEPKTEPDKEALVKILDGKAPLRVVAHWRQDIKKVLEVAEKHSLKVVLVGASEAWRMLDELEKAKVSIVLEPVMDLGGDVLDRVAYDPDMASKLAEAGIHFAFMTAGAPGFGPENLGLIASLAVASGLSEEAALAALTSGAAKTLGLGDRLGTVEAGRMAALQIRSGDPLDPASRVETMILGRQVIKP